MKIIIPDKVSKTSAKMFEETGVLVDQKAGATIEEANDMAKDADAIVVRSYKLHDLKFNENILAVGRAGAGVNNIPVDKCSEMGIVVFNTPGGNANAVKELVLCGLLLSSRKIVDGINWTALQKETPDDLGKAVEKNKSQFKGQEIKGKKLGVIGLGAVGLLVANDAYSLGMDVMGFDPFITVENAWKLQRTVNKAKNIDQLISHSDYITIHVPLMDQTRGMIDKKMFSAMKKGVKIMNFSRAEIVNTKDLIEAIKSGIVSSYVTDFPEKVLLELPQTIAIPHLGASTAEAEENCAVMIAEQMIDFLRNGNIVNSVNFPNAIMERNGNTRIAIVNKNVPGMIEHITDIIAKHNLNIAEFLNKSKGEVAYNILDVDGEITDNVTDEIQNVEGVIKVRKIVPD